MGDEGDCGAEVPVPFTLRLSMAAARDTAHDAATAAAMSVLTQAGVPRTGEAEEAGEDPLARYFNISVGGFAPATRHGIMRLPRALFSRSGPPAGRAFLLALEHALWTELVSVISLTRELQDRKSVV